MHYSPGLPAACREPSGTLRPGGTSSPGEVCELRHHQNQLTVSPSLAPCTGPPAPPPLPGSPPPKAPHSPSKAGTGVRSLPGPRGLCQQSLIQPQPVLPGPVRRAPPFQKSPPAPGPQSGEAVPVCTGC